MTEKPDAPKPVPASDEEIEWTRQRVRIVTGIGSARVEKLLACIDQDRATIAAKDEQIKRCHGIMQGLVSLTDPEDDIEDVLLDAHKELEGGFCPGQCTSACDATIASERARADKYEAESEQKGADLMACEGVLEEARAEIARLESMIVRHRDAATDERGEGAVIACTDLDDEANRITARAALKPNKEADNG